MMNPNSHIEICSSLCCGCGACAAVCPKKAIVMEKDEHGFLYPAVDDEKCINCGICLKHCPVADIGTAENLNRAYYGWAKDMQLRQKSSSGGVFSLLAENVLAEGGVVFGAAFQKEDKSVYYKSTDDVPLDALRRSKYTESQTGDIFPQIKHHLDAGRKVMFCGTPCHAAGLKAYLQKDYADLLVCDFVCGGAASPSFFKNHLDAMESKYKFKIDKVNFRDKKYGWKRMTLTVSLENGKEKSSLSYFDSYFTGFINGIIKRPNCFRCPFADNHFSDITIADYWGYKSGGVKYERDGISMMVAHSARGQAAVDAIRPVMYCEEMPAERTRYTIKKRQFSEEKFTDCKAFLDLASQIGYEAAAKQTYMKSPLKDLLLAYFHIK